jgi:hypothetical protein
MRPATESSSFPVKPRVAALMMLPVGSPTRRAARQWKRPHFGYG